jgi:hypothetical protein
MSFTLKIEAHIWLAHWIRNPGTFRCPPTITLNLARSRNLVNGDHRKLADTQTDNAFKLIKDIFAEQIAVPACSKVFNEDWKTVPNFSPSNIKSGWIVGGSVLTLQTSLY